MWKIISLFYLESLTWQLQILPDTEQKCGKKLNPLQKKKVSSHKVQGKQNGLPACGNSNISRHYHLADVSSLFFSKRHLVNKKKNYWSTNNFSAILK